MCKGYESLLAKKQCAVIMTRKDGLWLGLALDPDGKYLSLKDAKVLRVNEKIKWVVQIQEESVLNVDAKAHWKLTVDRFS